MKMTESFHEGGFFYLVFKLAEGKPALRENLIQFDESQKALIAMELLFGICCSHMRGVFHLDIADGLSPPTVNAMIDSEGRISLLDFGDGSRDCTQENLKQDIQSFLCFVKVFTPTFSIHDDDRTIWKLTILMAYMILVKTGVKTQI